MPDFDLSALGGDVPAWLKWIIDNKDLILSLIAGLAAGLLAWKLGLDGLTATGIGLLVAGVVLAIQSLLAYIKDPSWSNFGKLISGIGVAIAGLGVIIASVTGGVMGLPIIIAGVVIAIVGIIVKHWEQIKTTLQNGIDWLKSKSDWIHTMIGNTAGNIYDLIVKILQSLLNWFDNTFKNLKKILDGIIEFIKGIFTGNIKMILDGLKKIVASLLDWLKNTVSTVFWGIVNFIDICINAIKGFFQLMWLGISSAGKSVINEIKANFGGIASWFGGIINNVLSKFRDFGTRAGEVISGAFKGVVNGVLRAIENILNSPIRAINSLISVINAVPGVNLSRLNTFSLPRLATGGIINMPNRGINIGGAIAGESGREGVIPLTDSQAMETLGEAIGRYININATVPVYVGNRQIAREIRKINADRDFAYNK